MENKFFETLAKIGNTTTTENGATAYRDKCLKPIVKWIYNISDNRSHINAVREDYGRDYEEHLVSKHDSIILTNMVNEIREVTKSNKNDQNFIDLVGRYLGYIRDPRRGLGERSLFRTALIYLINDGTVNPTNYKKFCEAIIEYGRYDDLIALFFNVNNINIKNGIFDYIKCQLEEDSKSVIDYYKDSKNKRPISLLAKWMPSINTSSKETVVKAKHLAKELGMTDKQYRKGLAALRKYLNIVETNICQNTYENIDYSVVPSMAMNLHKETFVNKDGERYKKYLESLKKGETKVNAKVISPIELIAEVRNSYYKPEEVKDIIREQWKALPDINLEGNILPICDVSGSMFSGITNKIQCIDASIGMSIYLAQHNKGTFKNMIVNFDDRPNVCDISDCGDDIFKAYDTVVRMHDGYSTNVEAVLKLVLDIARTNSCKQEDIPALLFVSDCEFNRISTDNVLGMETLFDTYAKKFKEIGYTLPKIIFWNTQNRTASVPMISNENGLILVSGFSVNIINMITDENYDSYQAITDELNKEWLDNTKYLVK